MFHGSIVALVTPMQADGSIDYEGLSQLIEWQIASGTAGIVVLGTTGESATVSGDERQKVIRRAVTTAAGKVPIIAGTGSNATEVTIQQTRDAMDWGVDACLLVTPYYNKPTQEGLYQHYKAVAEAVGVPQILYNVPSRTGCDLLPSTVARLTHFANIVAIKEASPDPQRPAELMALLRDGDGQGTVIDVLSGDDINALACIKLGAKGVVSVTANVAPHLVHALCEAALAGDFEAAEKQDKQLRTLNTVLFVESNPIPTKWALMEMGKIPAGIRLPLTQLTQPKHNEVRAALVEVGLIE